MTRTQRFVIAALAAHRATRALTTDTISEPLRHRLWMWSMIDVTPEQRRRREWLAGDTEKGSEVQGLINCGHCAGFHLSYLTLAALALAGRWRWRWLDAVVVAWAVAGVQDTLASLQGALDVVGHVDSDAVNDATEATAQSS